MRLPSRLRAACILCWLGWLIADVGGYGNEIIEVHRCLRAGAVTSELVPRQQTLSLMRQMDDVRRQIGVLYRG